MAFEMEIVDTPTTLPLEWDYDFDRGRTLLKVPTARQGVPRVEFQATLSGTGIPNSSQIIDVELIDPSGESSNVFYGDVRETELERLIDRFYEPDAPDTVTGTVEVGFDPDDIVGQYERGNYSELSPGPLTLSVSILGSFGRGTRFGPATAPTRLDVPSGAKVRENTTIDRVDLSVSGTTVDPKAEITAQADHGVDLPLRVVGLVGDEQVVAQDVETTVTGEATTRVNLPDFELNGIPYQDNRLTYRVMPREWADGWVNVAETARDVANISVNDVEITGCRTRPQQLRAGGDLTVNSSVRNPLPTAVDVEGQFIFGGATSPFSKGVPAGGVTQLSASFTATAVGTATPTIELSTVDGIGVSAQSSCGEVTVDPAFSADRISVDSCSVDTPNDVRPGDDVEATATVTNSSYNAATTATVAFTSAGDTVTQSVGLAPGEAKTVSASFSFPEAGDYPIDVGLKNATVR